jgi:hypothetical protein
VGPTQQQGYRVYAPELGTAAWAPLDRVIPFPWLSSCDACTKSRLIQIQLQPDAVIRGGFFLNRTAVLSGDSELAHAPTETEDPSDRADFIGDHAWLAAVVSHPRIPRRAPTDSAVLA